MKTFDKKGWEEYNELCILVIRNNFENYGKEEILWLS